MHAFGAIGMPMLHIILSTKRMPTHACSNVALSASKLTAAATRRAISTIPCTLVALGRDPELAVVAVVPPASDILNSILNVLPVLTGEGLNINSYVGYNCM